MRRLTAVLPLVLISCGLALYLAGWTPESVVNSLQDLGLSHRPEFAVPVFIVLGTLCMAMMIPKTLVSLTAGALFPLPTACLVLVLTAVTAAIVNYHLARWCWPIRRQIGNAENDAAAALENGPAADAALPEILAHMARGAGYYLHLLIRLSPIPTTIISYTMGAVGAKRTPYIVAAFLAAFPQLLYVYASNAAVNSHADGRSQSASDLQQYSSWGTLCVAIVVSIILPRIALTQIRLIRNRPTLASPR
ncbi:VTT domain-containing protein [Rhodopirellula sp. MGV]|uniref:VTT domain-containing protein n=1 Tax=Rhodopirellula sp. MGV TaxID=2023130 RepID=UPI000B96A5E1|nr:VTT domain-containing protein [Rhodopirellula sp. MGV]OYP38184.1 hypothetical protein CGZ80_02865 [Rhodopirellula sp. MGV]PNY38517.1 DedA family protein [Rhodopirellula baltica]